MGNSEAQSNATETTPASTPLEVEAKLAAPRPAVLSEIEGTPKIDDFSLRHRKRKRIETLYLDTRSRTLAREGIAFRLRRNGRHWEASAKWGGRRNGAVHERHELNLELDRPPDEPYHLPDELRQSFLASLVAGRPLVALFRTQVQRTEIDVTRGDRTVAELALDRVHLVGEPASGTGASRFSPRYCEVEIESRTDDRESFSTFCHRFARTFALEPSEDSKFRLGLRAFQPDVLDATPAPPPRWDSPASEVLRFVVAEQLERLRRADAVARKGEDPEGVHDMRVATRRIRATLRVLGDAVPERSRPRLAEDLRWLRQSLGEIRDLDVRIELAEELRPFGKETDAGVTHLIEVLRRRREEHQELLHRALDSRRYFHLLQRLEAIAFGTARLHPGPTLGEAAAPALQHARRRLDRMVQSFSDPPSPAELHRVRIRAKKLRYPLELVLPCVGKPAARLLRRLKALQDTLGRHHDLHVLIDTARDVAGTVTLHRDPSGALALGSVIGCCEREAELLERDYARQWKKLTSRKARRDWKRVLDAL